MNGQPSADAVPRWASGVRRLVVLSGAGISTDSGIPDFRGPTGAWTLNPGAEHRNTYQAFVADPALRAEYWQSRYEHPVWRAEPNAGHRAVTELVNSGVDTTVVTQNTDGLHQRAGTPAERVIEVHGTMREVECIGCGHRSPTTDTLARIGAGETVPPCLRCGGILKTASTMFGQTMSPEVFASAERAATRCDLLLAVGTTLTVEPAASLSATAVRAGAALVILNRDPTPYDGIATEIIRAPLGESLPCVAGLLLKQAARQGHTAPLEPPAGPGGSLGAVRPSQLLRAAARTAMFRSREAELERLMAWCAGGGARVQLMSGPAGAGKTRLALELADRLAAIGKWEVEFLPLDASLPAGTNDPLLAVVDDAETRQDQVAGLVRAAAAPRAAPLRVLLLARTRGAWWDALPPALRTSQELAPPYQPRGRADRDPGAGRQPPGAGRRPDTEPEPGIPDHVRDIAEDYARALTAAGLACPHPGQALHGALAEVPGLPGPLQAAVLAALLGPGEHGRHQLPRHESAWLRRACQEHRLELPGDIVAAAAATAVLCGAGDEQLALTALGHIPELADPAVRLRAARWLREAYPPAAGQQAYWDESLPDPLTEDLIAAVVTPRFLMRMLLDTAPQQDQRALTILARAAATRPGLAACLTELLSVLPGLSPVAVSVALGRGHPAPLADALTALARTAALPADLLEAVPAGTTVLGEFPVLLATSLAEAYQRRAATQPRGLATMLIELAERLADIGRAAEAVAAAQRAVRAAARLGEESGYPALAQRSLRRATGLGGRQSADPPPGHTSAGPG